MVSFSKAMKFNHSKNRDKPRVRNLGGRWKGEGGNPAPARRRLGRFAVVDRRWKMEGFGVIFAK
jgi:hypothetical protein